MYRLSNVCRARRFSVPIQTPTARLKPRVFCKTERTVKQKRTMKLPNERNADRRHSTVRWRTEEGAVRLNVGTSSESKLEPIASKLQEAANRCVADVVERKMAYENSTHCRSLSGIAQGYIQAGGFTDKTSCPADRIAETARARAWKALAVSRTGDAGLAVW